MHRWAQKFKYECEFFRWDKNIVISFHFISRKQRDNVFGSVCLPVCLSVHLQTLSRLKSHYQSKVFVCVSINRADVVDQLLILFGCFQHESVRLYEMIENITSSPNVGGKIPFLSQSWSKQVQYAFNR